MKHIKTYKLFENDSNDDMKEYISDILISLLDNNFEYTINELSPNEIRVEIKHDVEISDDGRIKSSKAFKINTIALDLLQLVRYMQSEGYDVNIWGRSYNAFKKDYREVEVDKLTKSKILWSFINLYFKKSENI